MWSIAPSLQRFIIDSLQLSLNMTSPQGRGNYRGSNLLDSLIKRKKKRADFDPHGLIALGLLLTPHGGIERITQE